MISPEYCRTMARYNAWQNSQLSGLLETMDEAGLRRDRGAFFGSILGTLSHLAWGDALWVSRFDGGEAFALGGEQSAELFAGFAAWAVARRDLDARISGWAQNVKGAELQGSLQYYSGVMGRKMSKPMGLCVLQLFNHQTHHRGQVHAMMTAAGWEAPVSDLPFMPDVE